MTKADLSTTTTTTEGGSGGGGEDKLPSYLTFPIPYFLFPLLYSVSYSFFRPLLPAPLPFPSDYINKLLCTRNFISLLIHLASFIYYIYIFSDKRFGKFLLFFFVSLPVFTSFCNTKVYVRILHRFYAQFRTRIIYNPL